MPRIKLGRRRALLLATLTIAAGVVTISACSSEENPPAGTVSLALSPTSVNIAPGGSGTVAATITRGGSFSGAVTLTASGNPTGVTVTFSPDEIPGAATTATVEISVGSAVTTGDKTITINAAGNGVTTATATLTVTVVPATNGGITLGVDPNALTANVGGAAVTSTITVTRTAPFTGPVALTVTGAPAGVTATVNPTSVTAATSTLTVQATTGAVNGLYPLVVHAAGTGVANATATVNVTVAGGAADGASFAFNPTSVPITAGGASATSVVTVTRTGSFTGPLNLAITGQVAGLTATVAPNPNLNSATSTVTVQATAAVAAGTYNLTLTGTGTGIPNATGTLPVVVSAAGGGGSFNITFCAADAPSWVAQQDGSGAWTRVNASSGTTYPFSFASGKGGIAFVVPETTPSASTDLNVVYGTTAEFSALGGNANLTDCSAKTVNGTVANVAVTELALISLGFSTATIGPALPGYPAFVLDDVADGAQDMVASRIDPTTFMANKVIIRRAQNIAAGGSLALLDFNAAEAFAPGTANVTVSGLGADHAVVLSAFTGVYGSRTDATMSVINDYASGAQPYAAVPLAQLTNALELNQLSAFAENASNSNAIRFAGIYFRAPAAQTVTMGPAMSAPTVTKVVTGTIARPRVQLGSQAEYNRLISASYSQGTVRFVNVFATAAYFGGVPATWDVTVPDLAAVSGFDPLWGLQNGTAIDWDVSVQGGAIQFLDYNTIVDGATFKSATLSSATPLAIRAARTSPDAFKMQHRLTDLLRRQVYPLH